MKTVAGIDMGTQSMKVVLYDYENKKTVESSSCPIDLISENDGTREQKTEWYKNAMEVCFSKLSKEGKATIQALASMRDARQVAECRGISVDKVFRG